MKDPDKSPTKPRVVVIEWASRCEQCRGWKVRCKNCRRRFVARDGRRAA